MAQTNTLRFRVRAPNGTQQLLDPLPSSCAMHELQSAIIASFNLINVQPACLEIKFILPPAIVISQVAPNTPLSSFNLTSGNLIVSILNSPYRNENETDQSEDSEQVPPTTHSTTFLTVNKRPRDDTSDQSDDDVNMADSTQEITSLSDDDEAKEDKISNLNDEQRHSLDTLGYCTHDPLNCTTSCCRGGSSSGCRANT